MLEQYFQRMNISSQEYVMSQLSQSQIPQSLSSLAVIRKLDSVCAINFKSFGKKTYIGPFLDFTSLIGPNGSGKSNVLEAMMFCFCSENIRHNFFDLREFITRNANQSYRELAGDNVVCSVEVNFLLWGGRTMSVRRQLDPENNQRFLINYDEFPRKVYENFLFQRGINCTTSNYAIWQGEIQKLIIKDPLQLSKHFQNLCGSVMLKKEYDEMKTQLDEIRKRIEEKSLKLSKLRNEKKSLRSMKQTTQEYQKYEDAYNDLINKLVLAKLMLHQVEIRDQQGLIAEKREEEKQKIRQVESNKLKAQREHKEKLEFQKDLSKLSGEINENHGKLQLVDQPSIILKTQKLQELKRDSQDSKEFIEGMQGRKEGLQNVLPEIHSSDLIQEYLEIYSHWQNENSQLNNEIRKRKSQLLHIDGLRQAKEAILLDYSQRISSISQTEADNKEQAVRIQQDIKVLEKTAETIRVEVSRENGELGKGLKEIYQKNSVLEQLINEIDDLESQVVEGVETERERQTLRRLMSVEGFRGFLEQKIRPTAHKYEVCFSLIFQHMGKYILCETEKASKEIAQKLTEMNQLRTVIILENVKANKDNGFRKQAVKLGTPAFDTIDYEQEIPNLETFLRNVTLGKVICEDFSSANKARDQNIPTFKEIYTIDGNIIRNDGMISAYGNTDILKKNYKYRTNKSALQKDLQALHKRKIQLESEIQSLKMKHNQQKIVNKNLERAKIERKMQQLETKRKNLTLKPKEIKIPRGLREELEELEKKRGRLTKAILEIEREMSASDYFKDFMQKHHIDSLDGFRNSTDLQSLQEKMKERNKISKEIDELTREIARTTKLIQRNQDEAEHIEDELRKIEGLENKVTIQRHLISQQKEMMAIRERIAKMATFKASDMSFKSEIPELQVKWNFLKEKHLKLIEQLSNEYGIQVHDPVNYSPLQESQKINSQEVTSRKLNSIINEYEDERVKTEQLFEKFSTVNLMPNVQENQAKVNGYMKALTEENQALGEERKDLASKFSKLSEDRRNILVQFVEKVNPILIETYKILTENDGIFGSAEIFIENREMPFDHGLYFAPIPPGKRFVYDLEQLSGGEKSIAALSLQYAIAIATKSPFLILDESDAFLDSANVARFNQLINFAVDRKQIQFMLITHKNSLFMNSQSLVGVNKPKNTNFSNAYSLKLED